MWSFLKDYWTFRKNIRGKQRCEIIFLKTPIVLICCFAALINEQINKKVEDIGLEPITSNMPCLRSTR